MDPNEARKLAESLTRTANPFAYSQPNPSLVLDGQTSWGRTQEISEDEKVQVVRVQLPIMAYVTLTARAIEFDSGTNPTQLYPYIRIKYGHGSVLTEAVLDVTGGWAEAVVGSTFEMEIFLADEDMFPPEAGSGAYAKIQGWGCVGITPYPQRNTEFTDSTETGPTALIAGCDGQAIQGRIVDMDGFVVGAGSTPAYLIFWDSNVAPGSADFGTPAILHVFPIDAEGLVMFGKYYANTKAFINGVAYGLSSSPTSYVPVTASTLMATVETLRDG